MYKLFLSCDYPADTNPFYSLFTYLMDMPGTTYQYQHIKRGLGLDTVGTSVQYCDGEFVATGSNADHIALVATVSEGVKNAFVTLFQFLKQNKNFEFDRDFYRFGMSCTDVGDSSAAEKGEDYAE